MKERKAEWKDRLGCWERMSASTLKPLTNTSHRGIRSMKVRWMKSCTAHTRACGYVSPSGEAGLDCGLNSHRYEGRRQRLLVMCLHIKKLKEIFTGIASLENFNNKIVLKSVIFFFCYCYLFDCHFPTSICRAFRTGLQISFDTTNARIFFC